MTRLRIGMLCMLLGLSGCDHHHPNQATAQKAAVGDSDSAYTGEKPGTNVSPRALPVVNQPPPASPVVAAPVKETIPPRSPVPETPETPPATSSTVAESARSSNASPTPATETPPEAPRLEMNPPNPVAATPPAPMSEAEAQRQVVVLDTSFGKIVIQMDDIAAPRTCGNFRKLVSDGFYNHTVFHRVIPNFMIQGGDPNSKTDDRSSFGQGNPGYSLPAEIRLKHVRGAVAMARLPDAVNPDRESNGSQFYICVADCPSLDGQYTVFGHVIRGMDVADKIANQPRDQRDNPNERIEMQAQLETKRQALEDNGT